MKTLDQIIEEYDKANRSMYGNPAKDFIRQSYQSGLEAAMECRPKFKSGINYEQDYESAMEEIAENKGHNQALQAWQENIKTLLK